MAGSQAAPVVIPANVDPSIQRVISDFNKTIAALRSQIAALEKRVAALEV